MAKEESSSLRDAAFGALGGVLGTIAMGQVTRFLYRFESQEKRRREEELRPEPPFQTMVAKLGRAILGSEMSDEAKAKAGKAVHWGYGIAWGATYALMRRRVPALSRAAGLPFAVLFSLVGDEFMNTALGITPPPQQFPWEAHARGLAGHVAFTATTDGVLRASDRIAAYMMRKGRG